MLEGQRAGFLAELPVRLATRRDRLRRAVALIEENRLDLCDALVADGTHDAVDAAMLSDIEPALAALHEALQNIESWMRPTAGPSLLERLVRARDHVEYQPIGVVGFVMPEALPLQETANFLAGALAAGNRVTVKLAAAGPNLGRLLGGVAPHYFDPLELALVQGDPRPATFNQPGDPSPESGKSPAIIGRSADFVRAAERVIADKLADAGRMSLAPDYLLVPAEHEEGIANWLWRAAMNLYPRFPGARAGASVSDEERDRFSRLVDDARARGAEILVTDHPEAGGRRSFPLHIVRFATDDMLVMQEELHGPILPLRSYGSIDEAIEAIHRRKPPLAIHHFGRDGAERRRLLDSTLSSVIVVEGHAPGQAAFLVPETGLPEPSGPGEEAFRRFSRMRRICRQPGAGLKGLGGKVPQDQRPMPAPALQ